MVHGVRREIERHPYVSDIIPRTGSKLTMQTRLDCHPCCVWVTILEILRGAGTGSA